MSDPWKNNQSARAACSIPHSKARVTRSIHPAQHVSTFRSTSTTEAPNTTASALRAATTDQPADTAPHGHGRRPARRRVAVLADLAPVGCVGSVPRFSDGLDTTVLVNYRLSKV